MNCGFSGPPTLAESGGPDLFLLCFNCLEWGIHFTQVTTICCGKAFFDAQPELPFWAQPESSGYPIALILGCRLIEASHTDREFQNSDLFVEWQSYCDGKVRSAAGFRRNLRAFWQGDKLGQETGAMLAACPALHGLRARKGLENRMSRCPTEGPSNG